MSDDEEISVYDEVEIEDMTYDETLQTYHYPCPCGDRFEIALLDLQDESNDIAVCPSCSLMIRVIYEVVSEKAQPLQSARSLNIAPVCRTGPRQQQNTTPRRDCVALAQPFVSCVGGLMGLTFAQQDNLPKPDEPDPDPEPAADEKPAQVPVAA